MSACPYYYLYNTFITCFAVHPNATSIPTTSVHVITRFPVATVTTRLFTRYTIRTSITSRWTLSIYVMTSFPFATVTTCLLASLTVCVIPTFWKQGGNFLMLQDRLSWELNTIPNTVCSQQSEMFYHKNMVFIIFILS